MTTPTLRPESGFATLVALLMVCMLTLVGLAALETSDDEVTLASNNWQEMRAFYAAEAGLELATAEMQVIYDSTGAPPTVLPNYVDSLNDCILSCNTTDDGPAVQRNLTSGNLAGLHALVKSFTVRAVGVSLIDNAKVLVSQQFETALVPIFQFAVFYDNDLEIAPGPSMTLAGRVHTNGDLWLQSNNSLKINSYVSAAGDIRHGRKGGGGTGNGDVLVKDVGGNYVSMKEGGGWLESTDAHWYDSSVTRWGDRVQDAAHGQTRLNVPLNGADEDPHKLIERGNGNTDSYEHRATLKIKDGDAYQWVGGIWTNITSELQTKGIMSTTPDKFWDGREGCYVDVTELDIGLLYQRGYDPDNGVIYFADQTTDYPALRITNANKLGDPLTIASENPIYMLGDFNSQNKKPASIMADAVTFLSPNWDDTKGKLSKNNRIATQTTVNACILTGNTETTASNYNGGFENLPRFLETWSNKKFTWTGSMVNLWLSTQADGAWNGTYYSPPIRDWSYDTDLDDPNNMPPEAPAVRVFQLTGWKQEYIHPES
ncbi:MAG: pilus assembly PilX N-terminal domain-containing protein [candidate division Zixibacteria bacterium]|nr:pilus assembly PilX N-terminal domain-containing protein [candidate division Zixibacteria bacterium]